MLYYYRQYGKYMTSAYNKYKGHFMSAKQKVCFYLGWWKWSVWWWKWKVLNKDTQVSPISCKLLFESFRETDFSIRRDRITKPDS